MRTTQQKIGLCTVFAAAGYADAQRARLAALRAARTGVGAAKYAADARAAAESAAKFSKRARELRGLTD